MRERRGKKSVAGRKSRFKGRGIRRFLPVVGGAVRVRVESPDEKEARRAATTPGPRIGRKYRRCVIHWVFLCIGIRDLHRARAAISIDTRVKTPPRRPAADQRGTGRDRRDAEKIRG